MNTHANTEFAELEGPRRRAGHWSDKPNTPAEKQDHMPSTENVEMPPWKVVIGLAISPLLVIGGVSLVAYLLTNWK